MTPPLTELVSLVERLHRENVELAGMLGAVQQRLVFAEDRIRALEAPREPTPAEMTTRGPTDGLAVETSTAPPRPERPWWRFW